MTVVTTEKSDRRSRKKAAVRAGIIASAIELFSEESIEAVTVDQIAQRADVGKGTIYNYFRTKEDIVVAFMAGFEREVQARLGDFEVAERPAAEVLADFIRLQFKMKERYHRFVRVFLGQMFLRTEQFLPYMAEIHSAMNPRIEALLSGLQKRGAIRADVEIPQLAMVFSTVQLGLTALWAIEGPPFEGAEKALEQEMRLFCEGLEAKTT